jgi:hypothetical protein
MNLKPHLIIFDKIDNAEKGIFSVANTSKIPFEIKRIFWIFEGKDNRIAGEHAHKNSEQVLVALQGLIKISTENLEGEKVDFILDAQHKGLYIPSFCWNKIEFTNNAALLSFSSMEYEPSDYIRDYKKFKKL